ncbi:MAG: alpha/beta hydrolase [Alphaproteobacteria bacterium]|nr:alpha/beta hydrolase [Alphaproteobacteria bacterium]
MLAALTLPDATPCTVSYETWGEENAPRTLVCVHGLTRNAMDFEKLAQAASAQGYRVIAPDMPGRGKSPNLANPLLYNNAVNAQLCLQLLTRLGARQVDWVGTSMGGIIAMLVANQAPGVIQKLVLNDVGCVVPAASLKRIGEYVGKSLHFANFAEAEAELKKRTQSFSIPDADWPRFAHNSITETAGGFKLAYDPAIAQGFAAIEPMADIQLWALWKAMKRIPTLLIRGERSDLLLEGTAVQMQATHPMLTRYNVANAGHAPALMTDAEISAVLEFLYSPPPLRGRKKFLRLALFARLRNFRWGDA